jgi:hypothetical protein
VVRPNIHGTETNKVVVFLNRNISLRHTFCHENDDGVYYFRDSITSFEKGHGGGGEGERESPNHTYKGRNPS